jgi:signal transduction histidine kinase
MWAIGSLRISRVRLACAAIVALNLIALATLAGWETAPIHVLISGAGVFYAVRRPLTVPSRDAVGLASALTLATIGNELLEGIEPANDVYESWLIVVLLVGLGWLAVRRAQVADAREQLVAERERLLRRQEKLMYDLSHELRTPATIARGHLDLLRRSGKRQAATAEIALDELTRIDRIVQRLLLLARAERGRLVELGEVESEEFLEDVLLRWSETADRVWRLGAVPRGTLRADPDALRIAVDVLLENAVKYTDPGDSIELRARAEDTSLVIEVADSGPGIPTHAAESIFARSSRTPTREDRPGLGLGLAIVDAIAKAHGGTCSLQPSAHGSTFAIRLPGYRSEASPAALPAAGAATSMTPAIDPAGGRQDGALR